MAVDDDRFGDAERGDGGSFEPSVDPAEVEHSEEALAAIGAGVCLESEDSSEDELLSLLSEWRDELSTAPLPPLPTEAEIAAALDPTVVPLQAPNRASRRGWVSSGEHHHGRRPALWQAVVGAAAVAAILVGGLSIAAHNARPGDPLWGFNKTIFSEHAGDVELVSTLISDLEAADAAAKKGDRSTAERILGEVSSRLGQVSSAEDRVSLMQRRDAIERDLSRVTPSAVPSPIAPAPEVAPPSGVATLVPGTPVAPVPGTPVPVIPIPLDGLNILTTLQIPIDPQQIEDFLNATPMHPPTTSEGNSGDPRQLRQDSEQSPTVAPTPTGAPRPSGPIAQSAAPHLSTTS